MTGVRRRTALAGCLLGVLASGCAVQDNGSADDAVGPTSATSTDTGTPASPAAVAQRVGSVLPEAPTGISLPTGTTLPVRAVSTTDNGLLDVPEDIRAAGWWRGGSRIGDPFGSTLIAAHVDSSTQGLGPFAELLSIRRGARLTVTTDTLTQTFQVRSLRLRPRGSIGPTSSLHSPEGERRLTLVTCAGPYIRAQGGYQNLAVVVATPVGEVQNRAADPTADPTSDQAGAQ